jgi:hypothetical protein
MTMLTRNRLSQKKARNLRMKAPMSVIQCSITDHQDHDDEWEDEDAEEEEEENALQGADDV